MRGRRGAAGLVFHLIAAMRGHSYDAYLIAVLANTLFNII
jgi:hypothetical protein